MADLARAIGLRPGDTAALSDALGIGRRWVRRYRDVGLTEVQADTWATKCGLHPMSVWPSWPHGPVWLWSDDDDVSEAAT